MDDLGSIHRKTNKELILPEKCSPFFGQAESIGLDGMMAMNTGFGIFLFKGKETLEKVKSCQGGFSSLEHESDYSTGGDQPEGFADNAFGCGFRHNAHMLLGSVIGDIFIKTISAPHIAQTGSRLYQKS